MRATIILAISLITISLFIQPLQVIWAQSNTTNANNQNNSSVYPPNSKPYNLTYSNWSARWWQWVISIPQDNNPLLDKIGKDCTQTQSGPVWFLAGSTGGSVVRRCTIPEGKAILFPVANAVNARSAPTETEADLRASVKNGQDKVTILEASVDGITFQNIQNYRAASPLFNVSFPKDNLFGVPEASTQAVADGYWLLLKPLSVGNHTIHFRGGSGVDVTAPTGGGFINEATYHLTIAPTNATTSAASTGQPAAAIANQPIALQGTSTSGKFKVQVNWTSNDINKDNDFIIKIMDKDGKPLTGVTFDVMLYKGTTHLTETHRPSQTATEQKYTFSQPGSYTFRIDNINSSGESDQVNIPIEVTPEFPSTVILFVLMSALFGTIIFATRIRRRKSFFMSQ